MQRHEARLATLAEHPQVHHAASLLPGVLDREPADFLAAQTVIEQGGQQRLVAKGFQDIPFKVPAREPVSWGNEEATGERDLGSGD